MNESEFIQWLNNLLKDTSSTDEETTKEIKEELYSIKYDYGLNTSILYCDGSLLQSSNNDRVFNEIPYTD